MTGIILAGGKSSRMGCNKSFLKIADTTMIRHTVDLLSQLFPRVLIISNEVELYQDLGKEVFTDIHPGHGPLSGIHSGLIHSGTGKNFVLSCDMPLMNIATIRFILDYLTGASVIVSRADGFIQQLAGVYHKSVLSTAEQIMSEPVTAAEKGVKQVCKVLQLIRRVDSAIVAIEEEYAGYLPGTFFNMNRPEEYQYILEHFQSRPNSEK